MGPTFDWSHQYFTMDQPRSEAVIEAFVRLHERGLIYRYASPSAIPDGIAMAHRLTLD